MARLPFKRLTLKLLVIVATFVLLGLGGFGWYLLEQQQRELEAQLPLEAKLLLNVLSTSMVDPLLTEDYPLLDGILSRFGSENPKVVQVRLINTQGQVIALYNSHQTDRTVQARLPVLANSTAGKPSWKLAEIEIWLSTATIDSLIASTKRKMLFAVLIAFFVIFAPLISNINRVVIRRIEALRDATQAIAEGKFETQLNETTHDEIGDLVRSFNQMGRGLATRDKLIATQQSQLLQAEKISALGQLSAGIVHEVKAPITAIIGFAQLAKRKFTDPAFDSVKRYIEGIEKESLRCAELIENLAKFARTEKPELTMTNINSIVSHVVTMMRHHLLVAEISTTINLSPLPANELMVWVDAAQMQQVLTNLILNGQQAMGSSGTLTIATSVEGGNVWIQIRDTGVGIKPENITKVFEPFFTTKPGQAVGLGLSVSDTIIKEHGGSIVVESAVGKGSTFTVKLPRASAQVQTQATA